MLSVVRMKFSYAYKIGINVCILAENNRVL